MNMDRFKFRVWDTKNKRYGLSPYTRRIDEIITLIEPPTSDNQFILEQCTGQPDENKKLIFENDRMAFTVFDCYDNETQYVGIVEWVGCEFMLVVSNETVFNLEWVLNQDSTAKIIGNIHESEAANRPSKGYTRYDDVKVNMR